MRLPETHSMKWINSGRMGTAVAVGIFVFGAAIFSATPGLGQQLSQPAVLDLPAPGLAGTTEDWLNTGGKTLVFEAGRVYVVEFWTFGCINCQHNLPSYARWQKRFAQQKLTLIGVHTPETDDEKKTANVLQRVKTLGISYPVLLDQSATNWKRWQQRAWPTIYLVDKHGHTRFRWVGELESPRVGGEEKMAGCIEKLLNE
jgi:thiol-disulfide isomerase/thioredoxin